MNTAKAIEFGNPFWTETQDNGLCNIIAENVDNGCFRLNNGHEFINMCSYSYLGLDSNPKILQGAIEGITSSATLNSTISRVRIRFPLLNEAEEALSDLFGVNAITTVSCASSAAAILPLIACGLFTNGVPPAMVFDKYAHFCLNLLKPICADETSVQTSPHNDLNFLEDMCKKNKAVAYVADGVYSTGGKAPVRELLNLQNKYGLFLFFDEAHGLSAYGEKGRGLVLEEIKELNSRTIIVSSLNKGFGAAGGVIFLSKDQDRAIISRFGGPLSWSQRINTAGLGAILASVKIHHSNELEVLQAKLIENITYFDELIRTEHFGDNLPIRLIPMKCEKATIDCAKELFNRGFYTSPLFFPIIPKGKAGLRVMLRANLKKSEIKEFCDIVSSI